MLKENPTITGVFCVADQIVLSNEIINLSSIIFLVKGKLHNDHGPAIISGGFREIQYYKDGCRHRDKAPALIFYYNPGSFDSEQLTYHPPKDGQTKLKTYYQGGVRHREDGPAMEFWGDPTDVRYYLNDFLVSEKEWINKTRREPIYKKLSNL